MTKKELGQAIGYISAEISEYTDTWKMWELMGQFCMTASEYYKNNPVYDPQTNYLCARGLNAFTLEMLRALEDEGTESQ